MRREVITYWGDIVKESWDKFPEYVNKALIIRHYIYGDFLEVDAEMHEAVLFLDDLFRDQIAAGKCSRKYHIDIDKKEIPNFKYFRISPYELWVESQVFCSVRCPTCEYELCPDGTKLVSNVVFKKKRASKLDIGKIKYVWDKDIILVISTRLKRAFETAELTGLAYEKAEYVIKPRRRWFTKDGITHWTCKETGTLEDDPAPGAEDLWIARMPNFVYRKSESRPPVCCATHLTINNAIIDTIPDKPMPIIGDHDFDFFQIRGIEVGDKKYEYRWNQFFISRKALEIMLKLKAKGMCNIGNFMKTSFAPMWE